MKRWTVIISTLLLGACAAYSGYGLKMGEDWLEDVLRVMGQPAIRWQEADGTAQLAYPRGPQGFHTYMAHIGADGKLHRIENVMDQKFFALIQPGMTKAQVLRILGPSSAGSTEYYAARDELAWEWRYCDAWNDAARFNVLFDNTKETVRSTMSLTEAQKGLCGKMTCWCAH